MQYWQLLRHPWYVHWYTGQKNIICYETRIGIFNLQSAPQYRPHSPPIPPLILNIAVRKRGKFDFGHHFALFTMAIFLKKYTFFLDCIFLARREARIIFKKMSKTDLPFRFCKIVLRNTLFILGTEMVVCL